jgi:hypothetical protein
MLAIASGFATGAKRSQAEPALQTAIVPAEQETSLSLMAQMANVSELTDVAPTSWAFAALQSLVERYGCITGYPNATFRGTQPITRYEFAAGVQACLGRLEEQLKTSTDSLIRQEDLVLLKQLQEEFAAELATLRNRITNLETRTATLEKQQFSATTKFRGQVLTFVGSAFGDNADEANAFTFGYRARLNFLSSFSGKDLLTTQFQARNLRLFNTATTFPAGRLSGITDEARIVGSGATGEGRLSLFGMRYNFPLGDRLRIHIAANEADSILTKAVNTFGDSSTGSVSYFGQGNPLVYPGEIQAGAGVTLQISPQFAVDFGYYAEDGANNPAPGSGLFNGGYTAFVRSVFTSAAFKAVFIYSNAYSPRLGYNTYAGSNAAKVQGAGAVVSDTFLAAAFYRPAPQIEVGASVATGDVRTLGVGTRGSADVWTYYVSLGIFDVGKKGNQLGFLVGMQPRLTGTSNDGVAQAIGLPVGQRSDRNIGIHLEAFYTLQVSDTIAITPGIFWLTAPNHDSRNPDVVVGVVRTTFSF